MVAQLTADGQMALTTSFNPPPAKCCRVSPQFELLPSDRTLDQLPDEILARILGLVDDPWLKLLCKGLSKKFDNVLGLKLSWNNNDKIAVLLEEDGHIIINKRKIALRKRWTALDNLLEVIHTVRTFSYTVSSSRNTIRFTLLKTLFDVILRKKQPLLYFSFKCTCNLYELVQLKSVSRFIQSCSPGLQSVNLELSLESETTTANTERRKCEAVESLWTAMGSCSNLKNVSFTHYVSECSSNAVVICHALSSTANASLLNKRHLTSLEVHVNYWGDSTNWADKRSTDLLQLLLSLPSLEKLALQSRSDFAPALIKYNISLPVKELSLMNYELCETSDSTFSLCQVLELNLLPNLTSLSVSICDYCCSDPVPLFDSLFQYWHNREPHFVLNFLTDYPHFCMQISEFKSMVQRLMNDEDTTVGAAPFVCPAGSHKQRCQYMFSRKNTNIMFSVIFQ